MAWLPNKSKVTRLSLESVCKANPSWNGRVKACRGIGASLSAEEIAVWEKDHMEMLEKIMPEETTIPHFVQMAGLKVK